MAAKKKKVNLFNNRKLMYAYIAFFVIAATYVLALTASSYAYENRIYPGVSVAGIYLGGKTRQEAKKELSQKISAPKTVILAGARQYDLGPELAVRYNIDKSVDDAFGVGRSDGLNPIKKYNVNLPLEVSFDHDALTAALINVSSAENEPVEDASIYMQGGAVKANRESVGSRVLLGENIEMVENGLGNMKSSFNLKVKTMQPIITEQDIALAQSEVQEILSRKIVLKDGGESYPVSSADLASFINFKRSGPASSVENSLPIENIFPLETNDEIISVGFDRAKVRDFAVRLSGQINQDAANAKLAASDGKVQVVAASRDGKSVKIDELASRLSDALENGKEEVDIPIEVTKPEVSSDNLDKLGLKELISTGWTDFSGSPENRIHNIDVGAARFNGVLIKPGEDFSFDDTLGNVDASTGYLPELVILKDKTVPEYGGGLCQVSTTAFRAALNAGLPILERAAHAYPVGYYKPYGVDATIYLPSPDLIFKNDTPGYILIQTRIAGNRLYFDFYGTKKPGSIKFAGDAAGTQGVSDTAEGLTPTITEQEARGPKSFTATFYRLMYDAAGKLIKTNFWVSKYDSPDKYPH